MKIQNIKKYVYKNCETYPSIEILKSVLFLFSFLVLFSVIPSIVVGKFLAFGFLISITIIYGILLYIFQRKCQTPYFILCPASKGILGAFISLYFLFYTLWILETQEIITLTHLIFIIILYIIILLLFFAVTIICIKCGVYTLNKRKNKRIIYSVIAFCSSLGFFSAKILSNFLNSDITITICVLIFIGVTLCGASGTTNLMKCYFLLKYPIINEEQWKKGAENLIKQDNGVAKNNKIILYIILIILFIIAFGCFGNLVTGQ